MSRLERWILGWLQKRCTHPGMAVVADVTEGSAAYRHHLTDEYPVRWCRICGAVGTPGMALRLPTPTWFTKDGGHA